MLLKLLKLIYSFDIIHLLIEQKSLSTITVQCSMLLNE